MGQGTTAPPSIRIGGQVLNAVERFQYLGSTISSNLSLEPEISSRIAKASAVMSKLHKRVWSNNNLTVNTKMQVYKACVLSTLLYSSESWTSYAAQETPKHLSSPLPSAHPGDQMAGQDPQHRRTRTSGTANHLHSPQPAPSPLARPRPPNAGWQNTEGPALRRALRRFETPWPPPAALQGHVQTRPEERQNRSSVLGRSGRIA